MKLRPYQKQAIDTLWNALATSPTALCVMSTGAGKTESFIGFVQKAAVKTAVLVGRDKLVAQTAERMRRVLPDVGVWSAGQGEKRIGQVTVVSIHSADQLTIQGLKLIICDEAHNLNEGRYAAFLARHPGAKLVGFTATPWRSGYEIFGEGERFERIHYKRGLKELVAEDFLVPPVSKAMPDAFETSGLEVSGDDFTTKAIVDLVNRSRDKIRAQVADAIPRLDGRVKVAWMCASIEHAEDVAKLLGEAGQTVACVHSKNPNNDYALECFERGAVKHMVSVMMLSEGYDFPAIDAIVLMRPTRSPTLYVQTVGRGLRLSPGKENCLVLDYGEVVKNCGPVHDPLTRTKRKMKEKEKLVHLVAVCPHCLSYVDYEAETCPDCGREMAEKKERDLTKNLTRQAADVDLFATRDDPPQTLQVLSVGVSKHLSKAGKNCIKVTFDVEGRIYPVAMYGSEHPYSWNKFCSLLYIMTPFRFTSWQECYDNCESLVLETPESIIVKQENGFDAIKGIIPRAPDDDLPF